MQIRPAVLSDAVSLHEIIALTWGEGETLNPAALEKAVAGQEASLYVAIEDGLVVGFVSSFLTSSSTGVRRWEVDLLAVLPRYQRQGIGRRLIGATWPDLGRFAASFARALIAVDNTGSQRAFEWAWYHSDQIEQILYLWSPRRWEGDQEAAVTGPHLIPVNALNYQGIWIEAFDPRKHDPAAQAGIIGSARRMAARLGYDRVGLVLPVNQVEALAPEVMADAERVGRYAWWTRLREG